MRAQDRGLRLAHNKQTTRNGERLGARGVLLSSPVQLAPLERIGYSILCATQTEDRIISSLIDVITLKTKPYYVEQSDGAWPPYAEVIASRVLSREPRLPSRSPSLRAEFLSDCFPQMRFQKWCSDCGEWVDRWRFGTDKRNTDGLRSYCDPCENRRQRRHYYLRKHVGALNTVSKN